MSFQAIREFINRLGPAATGLNALGAALEARASGIPVEPELAPRVVELLAALGLGEGLDDLSPTEAGIFLAELRLMLGPEAQLLYAERRRAGWSHDDPGILQAGGDFSLLHAQGVTRMVVPALEGLKERFGAPGAALLDVGTGTAGLAIHMARLWPHLRVLGIDPWQPSLALARANVDKAGLGDRIELREQGVESLADEAAFDLAWVPLPFMPERALVPAAARTRQALRPGGWALFNFPNVEGKEATTAAMWRLRTTLWGGPLLTTAVVEQLLRDHGLTEVRTLPGPPGGIVAQVVGRRPA